MIGTIYALIPALLTIALVIFTRRVVLSLGIGAISAAFILANFNLIQTVETLGSTFSGLIFEKDGLIGVVLDTGGGMIDAYRIGWTLIDLAYESESKIEVGINKKTSFSVKRWGW